METLPLSASGDPAQVTLPMLGAPWREGTAGGGRPPGERLPRRRRSEETSVVKRKAGLPPAAGQVPAGSPPARPKGCCPSGHRSVDKALPMTLGRLQGVRGTDVL